MIILSLSYYNLYTQLYGITSIDFRSTQVNHATKSVATESLLILDKKLSVSQKKFIAIFDLLAPAYESRE